MAQEHKRVIVNVMAVDSIRIWVMNYSVFSFICSDKKAKRGVEFCHSIRNAAKVQLYIVKNGNVLMRI